MSPFMLSTLLVLLGSLVLFILHVRKTWLLPSKHHQNYPKQPPGPSPFPIIGNLHMLGDLPHQALYNMAKLYGPIMSLRLGYVPTIIVSSAKAAKLFLKTHDVVFGNRPKLLAPFYMTYDSKGIGFTESGPYWRGVRKLCTVELLSASKVQSFEPLRKEELGFYVESLKQAAAAHQVVNFSEGVGELILNISCRMIFGKAESTGREFHLKELVKEGMFLAGAINIADYIPFLQPFDFQGLIKRMKAFSKSIDKVLERIIDEHEREARWEKNQERDFIDVLLSLMNQPMMATKNDALSSIDRINIKAIIVDMVLASADTAAAFIEWTLAELLRHPRSMKSLRDELKNVVGMDKMVEENHLSKLPYLDMVIKESMRLHPAAPLLIPHESMEDIIIDDYFIPKKSRIIVNAWAIGRDPDAWVDVEKFLPERFLETNIDVRGQNFQLIPFGSGRRQCPGMQLALTNVKIIIAQLMHCFDWELPSEQLPIELDMNEKFGLSHPRANHLLVVPKYRLLK